MQRLSELEHGLSTLEQRLAALEEGLQTVLLQLGTSNEPRLIVDDFRARGTIDPAPLLDNHPSLMIRLGNHPIRAALAASGAGSRLAGLGDGLLRSELSGLITTSLAVPLSQGFASATMILVHNESSNPTSDFSASSLTPSSPDDFAGLPTRLPFLAETLGFSPFNSLALMTPARDRSIVFELSPYSPAGLDIVPIPVPRGMDDWFAELFGNPPKGLEPGASPGNVLGASNDSADALREAVFQMLHANGASQSIGVLSPPAQGGTDDFVMRIDGSNSPRAADSAPSSIRPQSELVSPEASPFGSSSETSSDAETAKPAAKFMAGSMLGLFAAGMGQAIRHRGRRHRSDG
jgi:hypothetical protein